VNRKEPLEDGPCPQAKPKRAKKKYVIESRYTGKVTWLRTALSICEWHVWSKYATEKDRDKAMESLPRRHPSYEFRKVDGETE
jgi:hypothetical protein